MVADEQIAVLEQLGHALASDGLSLAAWPCLLFTAGRPRGCLGICCGHLLAELRQGMQDRLGDLLEDVEPDRSGGGTSGHNSLSTLG